MPRNKPQVGEIWEVQTEKYSALIFVCEANVSDTAGETGCVGYIIDIEHWLGWLTFPVCLETEYFIRRIQEAE